MTTTLSESQRDGAVASPKRPFWRRWLASADQVPVWLIGVGILVSIFLVLPTVVVIPMSFSGGQAFGFPPETWSLRWYENFFTDVRWLESVWKSVQVAVLVAILATAIGTAAAVALNRIQGPMSRAIRTILMVPLVAPSIVVATALYISFLQWHITGTLMGYVLAHTVKALPFVLVAVTVSLQGLDQRLVRAAISLGSSPMRAFMRVTVPLISPGIISGAIFAFVESLDEVVIALFISSPSFRTLPVQMFDSVVLEIDPTIAVASTIIVVVVTTIILIPQLVRAQKQN